MKKSVLNLMFGVMLTMILFISSCQKSGDAGNDTIKVGFAVRSMQGAYYVAIADVLKALCEQEGWEISVLDSKDDTSKEVQNMDTFISQGVDLIFLDCVDPTAAVSSINNAADNGIPVINLDSGVDEGANDVTTVYSDNKENGRLVGMVYAKHLKETGRADEELISILLSGNKGSIAGQERRIGLLAGIIEQKTAISSDKAWEEAIIMEQEITSKGSAKHKNANFSVRGQGWGNWTIAGGLEAGEDLITANNDLNCILAENDQMAIGAMTALENASLKNVNMISAADGSKDSMDLIKEGKYFSTGLNSPGLMAETGFQIAKEILVDGKDPASYEKVITTEPVAIIKENVEQYYDYGF